MDWMLAKDGKFSVKNRETILNGRTIEPTIWKSLWSSKTAHRIKLFAWKCIRELIPTKRKLVMFNSNIDMSCGCCGAATETIKHLLLNCRHAAHARSVWRCVNINMDAIRSNCNSVVEWVTSWFSTGNNTIDGKRLHTLMIGTWRIWKDICDSVFQGVSLNPHSTAHKINYHLASRMHDSSHVSFCASNPRFSHWKPPLQDIVKINVDASFEYLTKQLGTGLIVRDHTWACGGIRGNYTNEVLNAETGKYMAVREALEWAKETPKLSFNPSQTTCCSFNGRIGT
ncbi:uncharacterized protein LOC113305537 [Papaver somniferum]|uniref:uncharacterized protein LOC113305537 n=1 Tax=Papaver somniferum TaxID=3469 RepID=UPI000E6F62F6|nr:uncharacterized protein LOC113305537 [Papaver somniferum]